MTLNKLQNLCEVAHCHPRSVTEFMANSLASLITYCRFSYKFIQRTIKILQPAYFEIRLSKAKI